MLENVKQTFLASARQHLAEIETKIQTTIAKKEAKENSLARAGIGLSGADQLANIGIRAYNQESVESLKGLLPSPYFTRCDFQIDGENKNIYIGKFSFSEENIYSWITPVAALRFENLGPASYTRRDGSKKSGILGRKDQFLIHDGKILFLSTEQGNKKDLIYQENFSARKQGFVLQEVVELMEKAQDQIIRANHLGPLVISGPAGSGKTTLALHRAAYLIQSPETTEYYTPDKILVAVQDVGSKEYFSHLLPSLGIKGVKITTFFEWATAILGITDYTQNEKIIDNEIEQKLFEQAKLKAVRQNPNIKYHKKIYNILTALYEPFFTVQQLKYFAEQKKQKILDRIDLTILLKIYQKTFGEFNITQELFQEMNNGSYRKRKFSIPANYNLIIVDEFQNYLSEQINLFKNCVNKKLNSIIYVGDLAQQTKLGTIKNWAEIDEKIPNDRLVQLQKVYRNTKQILQYIQKSGYQVVVPKEIKDGPIVQEIKPVTKEDQIALIDKYQKNNPEKTIGIISKNKKYLTMHKKYFANRKNIFCLDMIETQGVEFDTVFLIKETEEKIIWPEEIKAEAEKIERDLYYVALTRAMDELCVIIPK